MHMCLCFKSGKLPTFYITDHWPTGYGDKCLDIQKYMYYLNVTQNLTNWQTESLIIIAFHMFAYKGACKEEWANT